MRKGNFVGSKPPYGYTIVNENGYRKLVINEECAEVVKRIFSMFLEGYTSTEIANVFNQECILTPNQYQGEKGYNKLMTNASEFWRNNMVLRIAKNEEYTGKVVSAKQQVKEIGATCTVTTPKENHIITENTHEAIVSNEIFEQVQKAIKANLGIHNNKRKDRKLFLRKIKCSGCNHVMTRLTSDGGKYVCYTKKYISSPNCIPTYIYERDIEKTVLSLLNKYLLTAKQSFSEKERIFNVVTAKKRQVFKDIRYQNNCLKRYEKQKLKAYEDYIDEVITRPLYIEKKQELEKNINTTKEQIQAYEAFIQSNENIEMPSNPVIEFYMKQQDISELTKQIADDLIDSIIVRDSNSFEIVWKFSNIF